MVVPLHKAHRFGFGQGQGGGGMNLALSIGKVGNDVQDLSPSEQGRMVGDAFARMMRASGGLRALAGRQRRGLFG